MEETDKVYLPTREKHYSTKLTSVEQFEELERRLDATADTNQIEGCFGRVRRFGGLFGSLNKVIIADGYDATGVIANVVCFQSSTMGIPLPLPRKLRAILRDYDLKPVR